MSIAITLDELPAHTPWVARLLGAATWPQKTKTREEVLREFEGEKWGPYLERARQTSEPVTVEDVDGWMFGDLPRSPISDGDRLELVSPLEARMRYLTWVESVLRPYLRGSVVELGCGYGSLLLALARRPALEGRRLTGGELTESGLALLRILAKNANIAVTAGRCDLSATPVTALAVEPESLVFTSYAAFYQPEVHVSFVDALLALRPRVVVHIEPCYEHCAQTSLLGLLRRRYIEVNDYNRNLATLLRSEEARGKLSVVEERKAEFGMNPLLAASVIAWAPR